MSHDLFMRSYETYPPSGRPPKPYRTPGTIKEVYSLRMEPLEIEGAWVFTPKIYTDGRGAFLEWLRDSDFQAGPCRNLDVAQGNCSVSRRGVIRGIHFTNVPPGQAKYITCVNGSILDVVVDIRVGSPDYGRWTAVTLDDKSRCSLFVAEGLGHAFMALSDEATVLYLCSTPYDPSLDQGVHPLDPAIGITWPTPVEPTLSEKDAAAPSLTVARACGLLPDYRECSMYLDQLRTKS